MGPPPQVIGCQGHYAYHAPDPVVRETAAKEGAMTAIVLDHKKAHDESGCRQSEQQAKPVAGVEDSPHQNPKKDERDNRDNELKDAARAARLAIASKYPCPRARIKCGRNIWLSLTHPATPTRRLADQRRGIASDRMSDTLECVVPTHSPWDEVST